MIPKPRQSSTSQGTAAPAAVAPPVAPEDIRLGEVLYQSSKSQVLRGHGPGDKTYIIKRLSPGEQAASSVAQLRHEYELLVQLRELPIRRALAFVEIDGLAALLLEDVDGTTLRDYWRQRTPAWPEAVQLLMQLTQALAALHVAGVLHRDVNPQNVLVSASEGRLYLIDFGIAARLSPAQAALPPSSALEGTLPYIAPEQTGRTGYALDERCDLYALGCTIYELITGRPPFQCASGVEYVHAHLARIPLPPHTLVAGLPPRLSAIVGKLLEKSPDQRYRGALGVLSELALLERELAAAGGDMPAKPSPQRIDPPLRLAFSNKVYGRDDEQALLLKDWGHVDTGGSALVLVSGPPGSGKTSLIQGVIDQSARRDRLLVSGKFGELGGDTPYSAFVQLARALLQKLLLDPDESLQTWKQQLGKSLGASAALLTSLLPELTPLLGTTAASQETSPSEAKNQLQQAFIRFFRAASRPERPLILFLDDLQWADLASLDLITQLVLDSQRGRLLVVCAYREQGASGRQALPELAASWRRDIVHCTHISLDAIDQQAIAAMVGDVLALAPDEAMHLGALLLQRTRGNPFFVRRMLLSLYCDGHVAFSLAAGSWQVDFARIAELPVSENVVQHLQGRMRELDPAVQLTLAVAALRGQRFTPGELAAVLHVPTVAVETHLQTACAEGLVVRELAAADAPAASSPETGVHRFVHDRIVEACQGLLETPERLRLSLALARHLTASTATVPLRRSGEDLFAALHHFNAARELVDDPRERLALARLNLEGGRRADASAAWDIGRDLYEMGLAFLPEDAWTTERQLTRELHYGAGASAMLAGEHAKAEQRFAALMDDARTAVEKAEISFFCCRLYIAMTLNREAIAVGMQGLEALGIRVRGKRPTEARAFVTALATKERLLRWSDERLLGLPPMRDERMILGMRLLTELIHAALVVHHELGIILTCLQIRLLMRHGHSPYSAFPFLYLGIVINGGSVYLGTPLWRQDQMQRLLALYRQLDARWTDPHLRSRGAFSHAMFMAHWEPGFRSVVTRLHELTRGFIDRGDAVYTGYGMIISLDTGLLTGHNLIAQLQSSEPWSEVSKQYQNALGQKSWSMQRDSNEALINGTAAEALRYAEQLDPEQVKSPEELGHYVGGLMQKGLIQTLYGDFSEASRALIKAALAGVVRTFAGNYKTASFHLLLCLALARSLEATPPWKKPLHYLLLFWSRRVLGVFARMAPEPFAQKRTLADALWALVRRRPRAQVHALLEEAARQSRDHGYPGDEALACELLGRLLLEQQTPRMAVGPLRSARRAYERWGLLAKVRELDELMGGLPEAADLAVSLRAEQTHATTTTSKQQSSLLDGPTLTRATHALSREINLEELKRTLMQLLRENAGARRAVLVWRGGEPDGEAPARVEAHVDPDGSPSTTSLPLTNDRLSIRAWTYVQRTKTTLIVGDVRGTDPWCDDQALKERGCRAMLCMPILKGGALKGAIYLENDLLAHAFSEERVEVLSVLAGQLAISLDNALLYEQLLSSLTKEREARAKEQTSHAEYIKAEAARRELQAGLEAAEAVQKSLLVTAPPTPLFELASLYAPAERAGGDWLSSYHDESHGFLYLFLGDVTGHGISSALVTAAVAGAAASAIDAIERQTTPNLAAALDQIGLAMNAAVRRTGHPTGRLMTMALIGIDLQSGRGHYRNAGQTPVLWFQGHETHAILDGGSPLGMHAGGRFGQRSFQLTPGDRLILYSDGLIENRLPGAAPAGRKLLKEIGSSTPSPHEALSQIRAYVDSFVADAKRDDVACIAFRYLGPEPMAVVKGAVGGC